MKKGWIILAVVAGLVVLTGLSAVGIYNRLVSTNEAINAGWAQVENVLQRRFDLIPNLVNTVKGYAKQEKDVLTEVTRLRSQWGEAKTPQARLDAAQGLEGALGRLMVVVEKYPELKSNQNFLALQDELAGTENRIAVERMRYNETVQSYNTLVQRFPTAVVARLTGFAKRDSYFKANAVAAEAPQVSF